jgi:hypothetical protein
LEKKQKREGESMTNKIRERWHPVQLHLQEGDTITSKKGILQQSPITKNYYSIKKMTFLGGHHFVALSEQEEIVDIKEINKED